MACDLISQVSHDPRWKAKHTHFPVTTSTWIRNGSVCSRRSPCNSVCYQAATGHKITEGEPLFDIIRPSHSCLCWIVAPGMVISYHEACALKCLVWRRRNSTEIYSHTALIKLDSNSRDSSYTELDIYHLINIWKSEVDPGTATLPHQVLNPPFLQGGKVSQRETDPRSWF